MKCRIHGSDMEYIGEDPYGGDMWQCEECQADEEWDFNYCHECGEPYDSCYCTEYEVTIE